MPPGWGDDRDLPFACEVVTENETPGEETGEGPCVDALVLDRIVRCADLAVDPRWPKLQPDVPAKMR